MNTKRKLRKAIRNILSEDANDFENQLKYIADLDGLRKDALEFGKKKGNEEEAKKWFQDGVGDWLKELGDTAGSIDELGEEMLSNYNSEGESSAELNDRQQQVVDELEKQKDAQGFISRTRLRAMRLRYQPCRLGLL